MSFIRIPMRMNLIKAPGKALGPSPLRESAISPPQADHVLVVLFFIRGGPGGCIKAPRHPSPNIIALSGISGFSVLILFFYVFKCFQLRVCESQIQMLM